ncbi:MAG: oligosaccharide flippase family protein [Bacilli bacterium]
MKTKIRSHVLVNLIRTVTITLLSFISFPFAAKALGDAGMGQYSWAHTFVNYFLILAKLGIPTLAIRECSKVKENQQLFNRKVQEFFFLQLVATLLSFIAMMIFVFTLPGPFTDVKMRSLIFLLSINFLVGAFSFEWVYLALEKHYYIAFRSIVVLGISTLLIISFIKYDNQIYLYSLFTVSVTIMTAIANIFLLRRQGVSLKPVGGYDFKSHLLDVVFIGFISLLITVYNETDTFMLGFIDSEKSLVGSYSVGIRGIEIVITIITSLAIVFIPVATEYFQKGMKEQFKRLTHYSFNIVLFIGVPAVVMMILLAPEIVNFIVLDSNQYWSEQAIVNAQIACVVLALMMLTYSLGDFIYMQVLLPMKKVRYYLLTLLGGVIFNLLFALLGAYVIFKDRPLLGVALAVTISDLLVVATLLFITRQHTWKALCNLNSLKIVGVGFVLVIVNIFLLPLIKTSPLIKIALAILISGIIYVGLLLLLKEELITVFFQIKKRPKIIKK